MEEVDKGCSTIMIGVSGWMFLLVPAHLGSPGKRAVKRLCVCVSQRRPSWLCSAVMHRTFSQFLLITETNLCVVVHSRLHTRQQHLNSLQFHLQDDRKLFSALTPLAGQQEVHPACKNSMTSCWCGDLTGARCRLFAYGPADVTAIPKPHRLLPHLNPDWFYLPGTGLPRLSWKISH